MYNFSTQGFQERMKEIENEYGGKFLSPPPEIRIGDVVEFVSKTDGKKYSGYICKENYNCKGEHMFFIKQANSTKNKRVMGRNLYPMLLYYSRNHADETAEDKKWRRDYKEEKRR